MRRRFNGDRAGRREIDGRDMPWQQKAQEEADTRRKKMEDWFLAVELLKGWDDKKSCTAEDMEQTISKFFRDDAKKFRISPRLSTEIFLRGMLRTLWDIDRLLRDMNPGEDLKRYTKSPLVLSTLRVCAYELMWTPSGTVRMAVQGATDLMKKAGVNFKTEQDFISGAVARMMKAFDRGHQEWDRKKEIREERKRREKAEQAGMPRGKPNIGAAVGQVKRRPGVEGPPGRKLPPATKRPKLSAPGLISARADMEEEAGMEDGEAEELEKKGVPKDDSATGAVTKPEDSKDKDVKGMPRRRRRRRRMRRMTSRQKLAGKR